MQICKFHHLHMDTFIKCKIMLNGLRPIAIVPHSLAHLKQEFHSHFFSLYHLGRSKNQTCFPIMETRLFECCLEPLESPELTLVVVRRLACDLSSAQQTQSLRTWCIRECLHRANSGSAWSHVHVCVYSRMLSLHRPPC